MGFHENLLSRKRRSKGGATARARTIVGELLRAKTFDVAPPPSALPFTVLTLAERWSCSEGAVRNLVRNGELAHFRVGDLIRISPNYLRHVGEKVADRRRKP